MSQHRRFLALGVVLLAALTSASCGSGSGSAEPGASTTSSVSERISDRQLEQVVLGLWRDRQRAIVARSASALEEVEAGPAFEADRAYWLEYCPGYCPPLLPTSWTDPTVRVLGRNAAETTAIALVEYTSSWATGRDSPAAAIVRVDVPGPGRWAISLAANWSPEGGVPDLPRGEVLPLASDGKDLVSEYLALVDRLNDREPYPTDPQFADGPFTSGLPEAIATYREEPVDQIVTIEGAEDDAAESISFTLASGSAALHCGLDEGVETTRGRNGQSLTPEEALGDYGHLLAPGRYSEFTVHGITTVCVLAADGEKPVILVGGPERTTVAGTKVQAS